ncbi:IclR-like transcriptional regulator [Halovivax ruber XH-70]|uniref:IclR-like transcriptional regulator n=1 Tax=Halovivax ruber (strain DSM 18193 / JCM 13892 / XH-70) TaxID=797302 RepID=L0I9S3_HALRX|nr:cell envelope integrity protein TolA [Halovivax ruber]AGB16325.1 IclR-like transcriptional regulator [Halovivax ruber XH-70]
MQRSVAVAIVASLLVAGLVVSVAFVSLDEESTQPPAPEAGPSPTAVNSSVGTTAQEFDRTTFDITVQEDGSARWTFEYERTLESTEEEDNFEAYADRFESEETDLYTKFTEQASALITDGERYTDREMTATDFNRTARVERSVNTAGVVRMSFTWEGFAATESERVVVSDVFEGGFYIMADQTLTIRAGENLAFDQVYPDPEAQFPELQERDRVVWRGEREFVSGRPYVVLVPEGSAGATSGQDSLFSPIAIGGAVVGIGLMVGLALVASRRGWFPDALASLPHPFGDSSTADDGGRPSSTTVGTETHAPEDTNEESVSAISDAELMTDEDRVVSLLSENGGRMKQVQIVERTDWSKSKVSMLLSEMESEGTISKLRVGRENIISLDGFEPEAARSPHETESQ